MRRRDFLGAMVASWVVSILPAQSQTAVRRPRLLLADTDPFTGLPLLKLRYAAGRRPPEDMEGWALSWLLTGKDEFAERALTEMRAKHLDSAGKASRSWIDYARWSLAFDWLFSCHGFDSTLKDRVAGELSRAVTRMLATPDFADPSQMSYHNYALRDLAFAAFPAAAVADYPSCAEPCRAWREKISASLDNVLDITEVVSPEGSYHESMDYMRITWASMVMLAELQRTMTGVDPAQQFSVFRNVGATYLYKLLPDGTPSREGDNEYPVLDNRDTALLGYAVNRFKDPYCAWLLRASGFVGKDWVVPVLEFLWDDPEVAPRNPALAAQHELPRERFFPGVGHLVMRNGWTPESTWIEFDCGPYLAKHQHLDQNQFTIYHRGHLAIDSGADYTDTESPHYLNYYRRTVAHNSMLVYDPGESFFWSDNVWTAVNDGGQRMDSARYWNTIRSPEDWNRTRDLWDLGTMRVLDHVPGQYQYALGDASRAYSEKKLRTFTRELLYLPGRNLLFVFDRVVSTKPEFHKAWLLHGVNAPSIDQGSGGAVAGAQQFRNAKTFRFSDGQGELLAHCLLPKERVLTRRGGNGHEFYAPGDDRGGAWGSGQNWPLEPAEGAPLPQDPKLRRMWKLFWGDDFDRILPSNRKNVVPGAWRVEISPASPAQEDLFLHVFEIGDSGQTGHSRVELIDGFGVQGAAFENGPAVVFNATGVPITNAEASLPDVPCNSAILAGLEPNAVYEIHLGGLNVTNVKDAVLPGVSAGTERLRANAKGILSFQRRDLKNLRLRIARL
jgi:hypothetical protein